MCDSFARLNLYYLNDTGEKNYRRSHSFDNDKYASAYVPISTQLLYRFRLIRMLYRWCSKIWNCLYLFMRVTTVAVQDVKFDVVSNAVREKHLYYELSYSAKVYECLLWFVLSSWNANTSSNGKLKTANPHWEKEYANKNEIILPIVPLTRQVVQIQQPFSQIQQPIPRMLNWFFFRK